MGRPSARRAAFTLVELLIVIAIITVLIAIALPVFSRARARARQSACMANLHQIAMAVRMYRMDMGFYPGPYDPVSGEGGLNALYPAYLDSRQALICPDDPIETGADYVAQQLKVWETANTYRTVSYEKLLEMASSMYTDIDPTGNYFLTLWRGENPDIDDDAVDPSFFLEHYSSYNDLYNWVGYVGEPALYSLCGLGEQYLHTGDNLAFWYMWYCWDPENDLGVWSSPEVYEIIASDLAYHLGQQTYWYGYNPLNLDEGDRLRDSLQRPLWDPGNPDSTSYNYMPYGMPSPVFPGLINRNAPDNTIITRCFKHRAATRSDAGEDDEGNPIYWEKDIVLRLDGSAQMIVGLNYDWALQPRQTH